MSTDEQLREIGRLSIERAAATRESALILRKIQDAGTALNKAGAHLMRNYPTADDLNEGLRLLDEALRFGDIPALKASVAQYLAIGDRLASINETLRLAGTEQT
jgi:hypothetical protein